MSIARFGFGEVETGKKEFINSRNWKKHRAGTRKMIEKTYTALSIKPKTIKKRKNVAIKSPCITIPVVWKMAD